jgi:hypothetical protein
MAEDDYRGGAGVGFAVAEDIAYFCQVQSVSPPL